MARLRYCSLSGNSSSPTAVVVQYIADRSPELVTLGGSCMRKFAAICIALIVLISLATIASAWYSYNSGKSLEATDDIVF